MKAALMGPLSGLSDSVFLTTLRVLAAGVGISMAQAASPLAPLAFLLIYNVPGFLLRIWGVLKGYELGVDLLEGAQKNGLMDKIMGIAGVVGIMVIGSMTVDMFGAELTMKFGVGDDAMTMQKMLDGIMPGMLGLAFMWLYYWLLGKKASPTVLILGTMALGVPCVYLGIFS